MQLTAILLLATHSFAPEAKLVEFTDSATQWVLDGEGLPLDWKEQLIELPPPMRLQALIFLRRSGLLRGNTWSIEAIMSPLPTSQE